MRHDPVSQVALVDAVEVHDPVGVAAGIQQVNEQAVLFASYLRNPPSIVVEDLEIRLGPRLPTRTEVGHVIGRGKNDQWLDRLANGGDHPGHLGLEQLQRRPTPGVVEPIRDDQQVGPVIQNMLLQPLAGSRLPTMLVAGTAGRDDVGPNAVVDHLHWFRLEVVDQSPEHRDPAPRGIRAPASRGGAFSQRHHAAKSGGMPVTFSGRLRFRFGNGEAGDGGCQ